jgi:branched-chain amino acid transport system permease protein
MLQHFLTGLSFGSLYALLGLGLVLTFRSTNVLNFAQGEIAMLMAFVTYQIVATLHWPILASIGASLVCAALLGAALYNLIFYPMRKRLHDGQSIVALSLKLVITGLVALYWTAESRVFPKVFEAESYSVFGALISAGQFWTIITGAVCLAAVGLFLRFTDFGLSMRVAAENADVAQLLGVNLRMVGTLAWVAAACIGALTGVLLASSVYLSPFMMGLVIMKAFAALVVGGMTSVLGVVAGGLLLGLMESLVAYAFTPLLQESVGLLFIIVVLLIRPQGLFGGAVRRA